MQAVEQLSRSNRRAPSVSNSTRRHAARAHTPTSHRTPTSRHAIHHRVVPSSPSFHLPRPSIQRSSSGSMTLGFGGIGPVPKSAKRWARSAHLHEVKGANMSSPSVEGLRHRTSGEATPLAPMRATGDADSGDIFSPPSQAQVLTIPFLDGSNTISKGKARVIGLQPLRQPSPLRASPIIHLASPPPPVRGRGLGRRPSQAESEVSEGDAWVDTDMDGSECDLATGPDSLGRERTYTGPSANSSL